MNIETKYLEKSAMEYTTAELDGAYPVVAVHGENRYAVIFCGAKGSATAYLSRANAEELVVKLQQALKGETNE